MESHLRVEIAPRMVPVTAREATQAALDLGQALQDLSAAKAAGSVPEIERAEDAYRAAGLVHAAETKQDGYLARIDGIELPLTDFAVQYDPVTGTPLLSLVLSPGSLQIGDPSTDTAPPPVRPEVPLIASWSGGVHPDPRESIPGWQSETLAEQVAGHAERVSLRTYEPDEVRERPSALKRLVGRGGQGGGTAVTA